MGDAATKKGGMAKGWNYEGEELLRKVGLAPYGFATWSGTYTAYQISTSILLVFLCDAKSATIAYFSCITLRFCYAMSITDMAYAPTRQTLQWTILSSGQPCPTTRSYGPVREEGSIRPPGAMTLRISLGCLEKVFALADNGGDLKVTPVCLRCGYCQDCYGITEMINMPTPASVLAEAYPPYLHSLASTDITPVFTQSYAATRTTGLTYSLCGYGYASTQKERMLLPVRRCKQRAYATTRTPVLTRAYATTRTPVLTRAHGGTSTARGHCLAVHLLPRVSQRCTCNSNGHARATRLVLNVFFFFNVRSMLYFENVTCAVCDAQY
eukprot:3940578-Rhodomonas_salina.2